MKAGIGDRIKIVKIFYCIPDSDIVTPDKLLEGKTGIVTHIDSLGQLHGTWGCLALIPNIDEFEIIEKPED